MLVPITVPSDIQKAAVNYILAEGARIAQASGIPLTMYSLKPQHLGYEKHQLKPLQTFTLRKNAAISIFGVMNHDRKAETLRFWEGPKIRLIAEWDIFPVYRYADKLGVILCTGPIPVTGPYTGVINAKGGETFSIELSPSNAQNVFPLGYILLPNAYADNLIIHKDIDKIEVQEGQTNG
jgi:hypothetical protein